jgi:hypothetical protein
MLINLAKAATALALAPIAAVADVLTMPASAHRGDAHPFGRTARMLQRAAECADHATRPEQPRTDADGEG